MDALENSVSNGLSGETEDHNCPNCGSNDSVTIREGEGSCLDCGADYELE